MCTSPRYYAHVQRIPRMCRCVPGGLSGVYVEPPPTPALTPDCISNVTHKRCPNRTSLSCALHLTLLQREQTPLGLPAAGPHSPPPRHCDNPVSPGAPKPLPPVLYKLTFMSLCSTHVTQHFSAPKPLPKSSKPVFFPGGGPSARAPFPCKPQGGPC